MSSTSIFNAFQANFPSYRRPVVFCKKGFFEILQNVQENTCARVSFLIDRLSKQTLAQMFSCEFRKIFKNNYFYRTTLVATSVPIPPPENNRKPDVVLMLSVVGGGGWLGDEIRSMI